MKKSQNLKFLVLSFSFAFCAFSFILSCFAEQSDNKYDLGKITVTPYRYEESLGAIPASVTIITKEDIKGSNAEKAIDVIRSTTGLSVRDYYGNGTTSAVDIAGFGEQAALNTLVLIDGRRANDVDLSGVDWSQIPLDRVERIEILRGGSAAVLYGDNASAGVINIITKKGSKEPKVKTQVAAGSYDMNNEKLSLEGSHDDKFTYWLDIGRDSTHGYRKNTFAKNKDFGSKLEYKFTDSVSMYFNAGLHDSSFGLPGALFQHHIEENSRQWARYGKDHTNNKDYYLALGNKTDFFDAGNFSVDFNYRRKDTDSYFPTANNDTMRNEIRTYGILPKYVLENAVLGYGNKMITGLDWYKVFYTSKNYTPPNDINLKNYNNIKKDSTAGYIQDELSISEQLTLVGGYRYEAARYAFNYHDVTGTNPNRDTKLKPHRQAFNSGVSYNYQDDSAVFFNFSKSFRFPEVDEFTGQNNASFQQFINTDLKPQSVINYQAGVRHRFNDKLNNSLSIYRMKVRDYIYYNPTGGVWGFGENENYDKTVHHGMEYHVDAKPTDALGIFANYTFTQARFDGGQYAGNDIPMVPRHKLGVGLRLLLSDDLTLNIIDTYMDKRYFINDQANAVSRLNGYLVADANLSWRRDNLGITFGVNNLLNKQYSEYAVYATDSSNAFAWDKAYYPSPERNFNLKVDYAF
ncbi:MAG: hypothetical protein COW11_06185 [Candidatus Omnitrophica bacterium CG12_big_fil_rev_8_21_14_0_65_43_15]|uniref:TonB-dependent receptor n=1 Tax=Candidatus Taenaricola geysiri TaxID=1974752 RepID=A0A2J0LDF8_9BACT|nr:MAG: hypothetical protein AUJ89_02275 [Candidatus Omnitrophica bacterium CG1_02_43_210]PIR65613.1 MAG: hypothetical protein COU52_03290 [Candidatus Omnitrophica bacterium CG10_big_fil_rev_8_21_14_0_10_43_8]PIW65895.1 MAG: hypothetical protein COW11_06185 [Candidatus Omnitrophica bacterium CG12_big_fil_rev_8_21_14_0_65_43_15]PJC46920.1 MAG: hypothetical protein CO036_00555 [Candidatus Omnitrophica bacterium CG_4_9_14_0_2_um_filter_43_12]